MRHTDERHATLREVACDRCGAAVDVAKFSPQHTSVQWNADSVRACTEWSAVSRGCASLRESIDRAVRDGRLEVRSP
ncbi:MAG TPA: hypothetical protein VK817_17165 [Trebonia sp.]|jgi:hypothetical protein|nr:hypothetical protein [Trebonia sp.]